MVSKLNPVFSDGKSRNTRHYIADHFLQSWLALAKPAREAARIKLLNRTLELARPRLMSAEGCAFEKLIRKLHQECSHKGRGDFNLSRMQVGYWNRPKDASRNIEVNVVAFDEPNKRVRFGSCKRSTDAHINESRTGFEKHVEGFFAARDHQHMKEWTKEMVLISSTFTINDRKHFLNKGYLAKDLNDFADLFDNGTWPNR